jgi:putative cell wall-binding protein
MTQLSIDDHRALKRTVTLIGTGCALLLAACASTPPPTVALKSAEQAIVTADQTRVADAASPELSEARDKLAAAQVAAQQQQMLLAERLAVESRVDAELASAKIEAGKAKAINEEMKRSTETLTQEMQRSSGAK